MERGTAETMGAGGDLLHGKEDKHEGGDLLLPGPRTQGHREPAGLCGQKSDSRGFAHPLTLRTHDPPRAD